MCLHPSTVISPKPISGMLILLENSNKYDKCPFLSEEVGKFVQKLELAIAVVVFVNVSFTLEN